MTPPLLLLPAKLLLDRDLALVEPDLAVAADGLPHPDVPNETSEPLRLDARALVGTEHGTIQRDMTLDHAGTENSCHERRREADFVTAVPHRKVPVSLPERPDCPEVELVVLGRVGRDGVKNHESHTVREDRDGSVDLLLRAHPRREDDRPPLRHRVLQEPGVRQGRRSDLVARRLELIDEVDAPLVPARSEPLDSVLLAVGIDLLVLLVPELEPSLEVTVRRTERVLPGPFELLGGVHHVDVALLELDRVAASRNRRVDETLGDTHIAIVVDADLGHNVHRMVVSDHAVTDLNFSHLRRSPPRK